MKKLILTLIIVFNFNTLESNSDISWEIWKKSLINELTSEKEFKLSTIKLLEDLKFNNNVINLDRNQPEFKLSLEEYLKKVVPSVVVEKGKIKKENHKETLMNISKKFNVDSNIIVALWGIESFYGKYLGNFDILRSLASLSFDGRRQSFFLNQLNSSLKIIDKNYLDAKSFKGSWAGAFGQTQFMPSTFLKYAVDYNRDGKKDLRNSFEDALASGANYLAQIGWERNLVWGEEIVIKNENFLKKHLNNPAFKSVKYWKSIGISFKKEYKDNSDLRILKPEKHIDRYFLVTKNFDKILKWNKSNFFGIAVGILSDKI